MVPYPKYTKGKGRNEGWQGCNTLLLLVDLCIWAGCFQGLSLLFENEMKSHTDGKVSKKMYSKPSDGGDWMYTVRVDPGLLFAGCFCGIQRKGV